MPKISPIIILSLANEKFVMPLAVTLYSALLNLQSVRDVLVHQRTSDCL